MPTALVVIYWLWTGISLVVLTTRGVRRVRARRARRHAWQKLGTAPVPTSIGDDAPTPAPAVPAAEVVEDPAPPPTADVVDVSDPDPSPAPEPARVVPDGPPRATRAPGRPRPLDNVITASAAPPHGVGDVLAGVRLPDDFVPVIDDVVAAAAGRCMRFDTARSLDATRADLVRALTAAGVETAVDGADELVARRGDGAVRITITQAPPTPQRPLPAVRVELATLS